MEFDRAGFEREVAKRLQMHRKSKGITQEGLASRIGLPRPSYANIEAGRQRIPLDVVWRAAIVLGVSISALVPEPVRRASADVVYAPLTSGLVSLSANSLSSSMVPTFGFVPKREEQSNVKPIRKLPDPTT